MSRAAKFFSGLVVLTSYWVAVLIGWVPANLEKIPHFREFSLQTPLYLVILFGCYSLFSLGYGLVKFKDCPEAGLELKKQIETARADLKAKGFRP